MPSTRIICAMGVVAVLIATQVVDGLTAERGWLYVTILTVGYLVSRGLAKSGSREPYFADGTNAQADLGRDDR